MTGAKRSHPSLRKKLHFSGLCGESDTDVENFWNVGCRATVKGTG